MNRIHFAPRFALFLFFFLAINAMYFWMTINPADVSVSLDESGPIEIVQLVYLAGTFLLFLAAVAISSGAERMFCATMAMLCFIFFFRELELDKVGPISNYLESKAHRVHETILIALIAIVYLVSRWRLVGGILRFVFSKPAWPFYVAALLLLAGAIFDILHGSVPNQIKEEIFECSSYLALLLIAASICCQQPVAVIRSTSTEFLIAVSIVALFAAASWLAENSYSREQNTPSPK
ncbi:hypothetical protein [Phyllobacterium zundukense]|jgi:hypothetical protein|uniref:Uncharacterized protein n=1 Tax=Phyllobacterium zundukense TaxID=1867719 RepID=A0ACD4D2M5_9HYPH|nr:hypothetical protein [Phyllobacterium zundukense]UXN59980.1 hypothetical protein N8E88_26085 [Phyllobacterium zundukense]